MSGRVHLYVIYLYFYDHPSLSRFFISIGGKNDYEPPPPYTHPLSLTQIQPRVQNEKNHLFCLHNTKNNIAEKISTFEIFSNL